MNLGIAREILGNHFAADVFDDTITEHFLVHFETVKIGCAIQPQIVVWSVRTLAIVMIGSTLSLS
ncbi:MAG: hypothetical protein DU489_06810 [Nitrosomonas sp.]|uniref:hypothetical protein n=1 Tax=Nitrosomonas sp. TaxID=42353 RepID=UPI0032EF729E